MKKEDPSLFDEFDRILLGHPGNMDLTKKLVRCMSGNINVDLGRGSEFKQYLDEAAPGTCIKVRTNNPYHYQVEIFIKQDVSNWTKELYVRGYTSDGQFPCTLSDIWNALNTGSPQY